MNKSLSVLVSVLALTSLPTGALAVDTAFNLGLVSDYRYRGISQSRLKPAVQGGIDLTLPLGFYVGTWASSIKWIQDAGGNADVEIDIYGGYKGEIQKDFTYDVGVLRYWYPNNKLAVSANTNEIYGALTYGPGTIKYSHSVSNLFGFPNSKGSGYWDASATFEVGGGFSLVPHVGYQKVDGNSDFSYTDYSLTVTKDVAGFILSAAIVGADTKSIGGVKAYASPANGKDLGKVGLVVGVKKNF